jgi:hypothetical protein
MRWGGRGIMKTIKEEKDIQKFIAKYPWLLNINYENIGDLENGMEYYVEGNKRLDLILRDKIRGFPVIVEFKYHGLNRETIGQILEYKARIAVSFNIENAKLFRIFKEKVVSPKLVLVVESSDDYGRLACNLQNIELFEYGNLEKKIINDVPSIKRVEDFSKTLKEISPPIDFERNSFLEEKVNTVINNLFEKYKIEESCQNFTNNRQEWCPELKNTFLNRWFLKDCAVSFGLYEDILYNGDLSVYVSYMSNDKNILEKLKNKFTRKSLHKTIEIEETEGEGYYLHINYESSIFYRHIEEILEFNISIYSKMILNK